MAFTLELLPAVYAICQLAPDAPIPEWASGEFVSITRTRDELTVVCRQELVGSELRSERGWRCLRLDGPFDLSEIGVLATLTKTLAAANVSVFVIGTFDTDYLLVREENLKSAKKALQRDGQVWTETTNAALNPPTS